MQVSNLLKLTHISKQQHSGMLNLLQNSIFERSKDEANNDFTLFASLTNTHILARNSRKFIDFQIYNKKDRSVGLLWHDSVAQMVKNIGYEDVTSFYWKTSWRYSRKDQKKHSLFWWRKGIADVSLIRHQLFEAVSWYKETETKSSLYGLADYLTNHRH